MGVRGKFGTETSAGDIQKLQDQLNTLRDEFNQLKADYDSSTFMKYKGLGVQGTAAKQGEVYSYDKKIYLALINTSAQPTDDGINWDLINAPEYADLEPRMEALETYTTNLKTRLLIKNDSTNLVAPNGTSQISIGNDNAFKNITGTWERLAAEQGINNEFGNYTRTLKIRELRVGSSKSNTAGIRIYQYSDDQMIIAFQDGNTHNIIAPNDKRIKGQGGAGFFT